MYEFTKPFKTLGNVDSDHEIVDAKGFFFCSCSTEQQSSLILKCVSSHDALVELCRDLKSRLSVYEARHKERGNCTLGDECPDTRLLKRAEQALEAAK